ncbi:MAG: alanine racemase [Acidobacteriota bacterium]|nr:alanine racemase [Acidobacteriota bacterium]
MTIDELATPAVLIDRARAERNLDRMQAAADARGVRLRPHTKTHKSPIVAGWQIARGAIGICCAKLGEAEVFAPRLRSGQAAKPDIRIPYPLNPANADRVIALLKQATLSFVVDHPVVARQWSDAMVRAGRQVDVLVKVDVGFHRCGIDPAAASAVDMVKGVAALPGLRLRGLLAHAGHAYHAHSEDELRQMAEGEARTLRDLVARCRAAGVAIDEVSAGATPPARFSLQQDGFTEYRPGNYVYFDRTQVALGAATLDDCALTVLARVVSKPAADRLVLDSGSKTLTNDGARGFAAAPGYGIILRDGRPDDTLLIERLSEEHATVKVITGATTLEPGDLVRIVPNHSCVVSNLVDQAWLVDGDTVEPLPIAARGFIT